MKGAHFLLMFYVEVPGTVPGTGSCTRSVPVELVEEGWFM